MIYFPIDIINIIGDYYGMTIPLFHGANKHYNKLTSSIEITDKPLIIEYFDKLTAFHRCAEMHFFEIPSEKLIDAGYFDNIKRMKLETEYFGSIRRTKLRREYFNNIFLKMIRRMKYLDTVNGNLSLFLQ
jgi:hypothetical protein